MGRLLNVNNYLLVFGSYLLPPALCPLPPTSCLLSPAYYLLAPASSLKPLTSCLLEKRNDVGTLSLEKTEDIMELKIALRDSFLLETEKWLKVQDTSET